MAATAGTAWAGETDPWVGRLLGRLHPMAVHFPIALLLTAVVVEALNLIRQRPVAGDTAFFCLRLGAAGAVVAALLGWQAGSHADYVGRAAEMLETHRWLGVGTAVGSVAVAVLCFAERVRPGVWLRRAYVAGLMLCGAAVSVGGHFGGMLVLGDDYLTSAIPFFQREPVSLASVAPTGTVDFVRDVQPIFEASCYSCHGPKKQRHELRLDARHLSIGGGRTGKAVIPGDGEHSTVVRRLLALDKKKSMPQNEDPLPIEQIALIKAWIDQGANWPESATVADATIESHWAYVKPERPAVPAVESPGWVLNPIDAFVLAHMEAEGLSPAPEANRATLLRRVYFDLIGLPPTPAEVNAFASNASPNAYESVVDRLLASPYYGERWAVPWLDAARYADSNGYQFDGLRTSWPYRDWVITALNRDMPFDQFTIEQIAGDLLSDPTLDQRIATGFHRGAPANEEAGADPEEYRIAQVVDRTNVTGTVWLGTTIECAQCHDHKHDPITQREYYQIFSYFNNTPIETRYAQNLVGVEFIGPWLQLPDEGVGRQNAPIAMGRATSTTLVMVELEEKRTTQILMGGSFLNPGEQVEPGTPSFLHTLPQDAPPNRLGLARWLVSPENPLVARVTVNRWWAEFFGRGLVESRDDFGTKGEAPSHGALLDWLAVEFVEHGWSMKHMHRLIATSSTYRQSSQVNAEQLERDPQNSLYARGPRLRLTAEMIRDNALAVSGKLNRKRFGPPVYPQQPPGLWKKTAGAFRKLEYLPSTGRDRYRRGLYTVWRRTSLYPSFVNFDAPSRSSTCVRRLRSNTPLQALTLLNDSVYVDLAAALAVRIMRAPNATTSRQRIDYGFQLAVARHPNPRETDLLHELYRNELNRNERNPARARSLAASLRPPRGINVLDWAAWFYVATTLLNLDETITNG